MFKNKYFITLLICLFISASAIAGTNTGRTCCCFGAVKRYHASAFLSRLTVTYVQHFTGEYDPYGFPKYILLPVYTWSEYKKVTKHICYSTVVAEVYDGWYVGGVYRDAKAHAERGPGVNVQWSYSNNPQIRAGEEYSFMANQEIDFDQFNDGRAHSEINYDDIKVEGGQLKISNLNGYNAVSNTSIFESSLKIIVYQGHLEDYIIGDPDDSTNQTLDLMSLPKVYETSLHVANDGVTGSGLLYDAFGQSLENNTFAQNGLDDVSGVKYNGFNFVQPLNTAEPDDNLGVLVIADDGISVTKLQSMYGVTPNGQSMKITKQNSVAYFTVVPNPSDGHILLNLEELEKGAYTLNVFDATGRTIKKQNIQIGENTASDVYMDLSGIASGNYYINLDGNGINQTQKLVIK